jgi:two-component system NtrC family sensor kinase
MAEPYRILIVEDSGTQALKLRYIFEEEGWEVLCAEAAEPALAELNRRLPDLVVVDYYLPGMRGDELCRRIRMNVHTRGVPILMLTVEDAHSAEMQGLESGADDYLPKSVDPDILLLRIRGLLRKSGTQSSILGPGDAFFGHARLLAIDDSPTYLQHLTEELRQENYTVTAAAGGREGLDLLAQEAFDCVLVDLLMPEVDGIEVCRKIREMHGALEPSVVVMILTSSEDKNDMTQSLEAGADDFVGKSSDLAVLKARIRALLRRKFYQEENRRIAEELKNRELEAVRARAETEAAEVRAALAEELAETNRELEETNRKLKKTQMHLIQTEKMASLGQLVAGIAHEINNPLAFVLNNVFTIREQIDQLVCETQGALSEAAAVRLGKVRVRLEDAHQGLDRVKELITDLRTFSRLDEGKFKTVDIHQSIDSVLRFLGHKLQERVQVEKHYGASGTLTCYASQLNQVLMNVLANAIDAIEGCGRITIVTETENGMFVILIRDTGPGIPEAIGHRIFEPFFTTKPVGQGTGLGLAISYGIVQAHHGQIEATNVPSGGTEFVIRIPMSLEEGTKS